MGALADTPIAEQITSLQALAILEAWNGSATLRAEFNNSLATWSAYVRSIVVGTTRAKLPPEFVTALMRQEG